MASTASTKNLRKIVSATWGGADTFGDPVGFGVNLSATFAKNRPSTRTSPALCLSETECTAKVKFQKLVTPLTPGAAAASLIVTMQSYAGGVSATVTVANARPAGCDINGESEPYTQEQSFEVDAADTEAVNPVTVSN